MFSMGLPQSSCLALKPQAPCPAAIQRTERGDDENCRLGRPYQEPHARAIFMRSEFVS
jgi:hypothetical protein